MVGATAVSSVNPILDGVLSVAIVAHTHIVSGQVHRAGESHGRTDTIFGDICRALIPSWSTTSTRQSFPCSATLQSGLCDWPPAVCWSASTSSTRTTLVRHQSERVEDVGLNTWMSTGVTELIKKMWKA